MVKNSDWGDVEIESGGSSLKIARSNRPMRVSEGSAADAERIVSRTDERKEPVNEDIGNSSPAKPPSRPHGRQVDLTTGVPVTPPMAGIFYNAPSPGAPAFVNEGDSVKKGQQVGIVEVMKLFTPVIAPCAGTVRKVLVKNEEFVHNDEIIMVIETLEES